VHALDVVLEIHDVLENQPGDLAHWMATLYFLGPGLGLLPAQVSFNVVHHLRRPGEGLLHRGARTEEDALGRLADEGNEFRFWRRLSQHGFLRLVRITYPEALPARANPSLGRRFLAASAERHHEIDCTDPAPYDVFWAQAVWEGAEDLLHSSPLSELVLDDRRHVLGSLNVVQLPL
jgi:hypothetical protein